MSPSLPARVEVSPDVLFQELEGEAVLLNLKSERYFGLDDVGTRMWQLLAENGDVAAAHAQLLKEYDVDPARLQGDLAAFIARLGEACLVGVGDDPATPSGTEPASAAPGP
jgi:hypothetical protein